MQPKKKIAIIGGGVMGRGIAIACAQRGYPVLINDSSEAARRKSREAISFFFEKKFHKGKITELEFEEINSRIKITSDISEAKNAELVIETIAEDETGKKELFAQLDGICPRSTILASNTSAIPISEIAQLAQKKDRIIGMHFMNPAFLIDLVEVAKGRDTSAATVEKTAAITRDLGKTPVFVKDSPGFALNRLLLPMINEAAYCLSDGVAPKEDIDRIMKLGGGFPMGPLELADMIGLDVCLKIMEGLEQGFSDNKYRPCPLLREMVEKGYLGRKTKKGFYDYRQS